MSTKEKYRLSLNDKYVPETVIVDNEDAHKDLIKQSKKDKVEENSGTMYYYCYHQQYDDIYLQYRNRYAIWSKRSFMSTNTPNPRWTFKRFCRKEGDDYLPILNEFVDVRVFDILIKGKFCEMFISDSSEHNPKYTFAVLSNENDKLKLSTEFSFGKGPDQKYTCKLELMKHGLEGKDVHKLLPFDSDTTTTSTSAATALPPPPPDTSAAPDSTPATIIPASGAASTANKGYNLFNIFSSSDTKSANRGGKSRTKKIKRKYMSTKKQTKNKKRRQLKRGTRRKQ